LQVLTPDGWITVPFEQLPDDLAPFPAELRKQIAAKQKTVMAKNNAPSQLESEHNGEAQAGNKSDNAFLLKASAPEVHTQ
jgi:hypothetical protein